MSRRLATMIALLLLGGCTVGPNHTPPSISLPAKFAEGGSVGSATTAQKNWWADFNDPQLTALVADGMQQNLSIAKALERITGAEAGVTIAAADGLPRANMSATATTSRTRSNDPAQESPRTVTPQIGFGAPGCSTSSASTAAPRKARWRKSMPPMRMPMSRACR